MPQPSLLQRIRAICRGRQFNTVNDLASQIPDVGYDVVESTVIRAIRQGLLRGRIYRRRLIDGPVLIVSNIRG